MHNPNIKKLNSWDYGTMLEPLLVYLLFQNDTFGVKI